MMLTNFMHEEILTTNPTSRPRVVQSTSREALLGLLADGTLKTQEKEYVRLLYHQPDGLTDGEAAHALGWPRSTVSARRNGVCLVWTKRIDDGGGFGHLIVDSGARRRNPGEKSRRGIVWRLRV